MNQNDILQSTLGMSWFVLKSYFDDLTDAELLQRPGVGCNHVAWQLGHLISSNCFLLNMVAPGSAAQLPDGFVEKHSKENAGCDDATQFCSKDEYIALFEKTHAATVQAIGKLSPSDLDQPAPERFRNMFPTMGDVWVLIATHEMMHAGQIVPLRRSLGKPVKI